MISPVSSALVTVGVVAVQTALDDKRKFTSRFIIGSGIYLVFLSALNETKPEIASKIALLVLIGVLLTQGPDVFKKLGVI